MFSNGRYFYVVFMCHLAIEKALKGLCSQVHNQAPPKTPRNPKDQKWLDKLRKVMIIFPYLL
ncbi:MAG: HEPN domain-containing protein [Anaerolineae bacterium]|nr:HEPN domain-containing protein [Anaerolineae bacterium]